MAGKNERGRLTVSRRPGQSIHINGGQIIITLGEVRHGKADITIEAPKNVPVHREEVQRRVDSKAHGKDAA